MAKGIGVISGSSDIVFKALETGVITMGSDTTQAQITITGSMTMNGDFVLNGTNVTSELTRLDARVEEVYDDLNLSDLDSVKELANLFKVSSSVHYSSDSTIYGWQTHLLTGDVPLTDSLISVYSGDLDDEITDTFTSGLSSFDYISRGVQPGWEFDKTSDAETGLPSSAAVEWFFYKDYDKDRNLSVSDLSNGYAVIVLDETGQVPRFDVYTHPESDGNDINAKFASRWEYAASGDETFNAGEKILLYFAINNL